MAEFVYLNVSPDGEHKNNCVTRAITLATGIDYPEIRKKLFHISRLFNCTKLCPACYRFLLENIFGFNVVNCDGYTVGEFADEHPCGTYIIRVPSHLTTVIDGKLYDIFDCRDDLCDICWEVE